MSQIKKSDLPETYLKLEKKMEERGDKHFCAIITAAVITGNNPVEIAEEFEKREYRKLGEGVDTPNTLEYIREQGFKVHEVPAREIIDQYPKSHQCLKNVTTHHPRKFSATWKNGKTYILSLKDHICAVVDGEVIDWSVNRTLRTHTVYEVTKK